MNILVTGANGFLGKNLIADLTRQGYNNIQKYTRESTKEDLVEYVKKADFIFHFAGVNRPKNEIEFFEGNTNLTEYLISILEEYKIQDTPLVYTSTIQASEDNSYGNSKKLAENLVLNYYKNVSAEAYIYRLPNLFGKWSKPNYNSVVSTFCHNIARGETIKVNNPEANLNLAYIDDVIMEFNNALKQQASKVGRYCTVTPIHQITLQDLADTIRGFKESRTNLWIPNMKNPLIKKLYSTYLSYLPKGSFSYDLKMHEDDRGSFTEFIRTIDRGQVSVNVSKPGITKGNHWHHTKNEKFLVVSGEGVIRFKNIDDEEIIEYKVSGSKFQVVDIPVGYSHSITNVGDGDLITVMWANEPFNPEYPDTYYMEV